MTDEKIDAMLNVFRDDKVRFTTLDAAARALDMVVTLVPKFPHLNALYHWPAFGVPRVA